MIAKNTMFLYIRMIIVMIVNLFAVRIVLKALGTEDYGVYNVVAGIITMLSCVTTVLMTATQRYYSYSIGEGNEDKLNKIYSASIKICIIGSILIFIIGETLGLWFVANYLVIPYARVYAANWLYHMTIFLFIFNFMQIPFGAAIIAHEKMGFFATISTIETFLKFFAALLLNFICGDRLILYGVFLVLISLLLLITYILFAVRKFPECYYSNFNDKSFFEELLLFAGWNFLGSLAGVGMHYVNTILVNIFFGPIINTAQAVAFQISSALNTFSGGFIMALRPPMVKLYAEKKCAELDRIFHISNKVVFYLMLLICVPLFLEMETVLSLWLGIDNGQTVLFSRLIVIYTIILVMNNPISIIMQATGYVKQYFIPVESITLMCPIITLIFFKLNFPSYYVFIVMISCVLISHFIRLYILNKYYTSRLLKDYLSFCLKALVITACVVFLSVFAKVNILSDICRLITVLLTAVSSTLILAYLFALNKQEKMFIAKNIRNVLRRG